MALTYTKHAEDRLKTRSVTKEQCEAAVKGDPNPWVTKLKAGDHMRFYHDSSQVTVITDKSKSTVITVFKGNPGGWGPEQEGL